MNKLVIVGNGFDLAHGLPTSYKDFIDYFWSKFKSNYKSEEYKELVYVKDLYNGFFDFGPINTYDDLLSNLTSYCSEYSTGRGFEKDKIICTALESNGKRTEIFKFNNKFFKEINQKNSIENWVDIENEYYQKLKGVIKISSSHLDYRGKSEEYINKKKKERVQKLNIEFEQVKLLFKKYLNLKVLDSYDFTKFTDRNWIKLYDFLKPISIFNKDSNLLKEFYIKDDRDDIKGIFDKEKKDEKNSSSTSVLNFNYTLTTSQYLYMIYKENYFENLIHIHGILNSDKNPINFGFGDEMDEDYKRIENLDDNEFLRYFKSFQYSQNSNYQNLIRFIESGKFQVYIMGHSCGLSDRTLLNTIFEHRYCRSIKVFYHKKEDESDNFTEIVQNISRHFNDKKKMREKIVNKELCQPLPQDISFQKKTITKK